MGYECKRCGAYYESQLKGRCHVHLEHGVSWKKALKELKLAENPAKSSCPNGKNVSKSRKAHRIGNFVYKGYLNELPKNPPSEAQE
jgi:hypothetical protein